LWVKSSSMSRAILFGLSITNYCSQQQLAIRHSFSNPQITQNYLRLAAPEMISTSVEGGEAVGSGPIIDSVRCVCAGT
jgi:hypothetical protein